MTSKTAGLKRKNSVAQKKERKNSSSKDEESLVEENDSEEVCIHVTNYKNISTK